MRRLGGALAIEAASSRVLVIPPYGAPPHGPQSQLSIDISLAAIAQELEARGVRTPAGQGPLGAYASLAAAGGLRVFECSTCGLAGRDGRGYLGLPLPLPPHLRRPSQPQLT